MRTRIGKGTACSGALALRRELEAKSVTAEKEFYRYIRQQVRQRVACGEVRLYIPELLETFSSEAQFGWRSRIEPAKVLAVDECGGVSWGEAQVACCGGFTYAVLMIGHRLFCFTTWPPFGVGWGPTSLAGRWWGRSGIGDTASRLPPRLVVSQGMSSWWNEFSHTVA